MLATLLAAFVIGLREGLEAALVIGILMAYLVRLGRRDVLPRMWAGVGLAIALSVLIGAILTFGAYALTTQAQELIGGGLSLLAVAMVTWMVFWMQKAGRTMKASLEGGIDRALASGSLWSLVVIGFVSVAREGMETTLLLWSMVQSLSSTPAALLGALLGLLVSAALGWLIARGAVRLDLRRFFAWTGGFLIVVAAGVLAYGINDLQEAGFLPGPYSALATTDPDTGSVAVGLSGFPFGWAFDVSAVIAPSGVLRALLQATVGFTPMMSWLQVIGWALYIGVVFTLYLRGLRRPKSPPSARVGTDAADEFTHSQQGAQ